MVLLGRVTRLSSKKMTSYKNSFKIPLSFFYFCAQALSQSVGYTLFNSITANDFKMKLELFYENYSDSTTISLAIAIYSAAGLKIKTRSKVDCYS